MEVLQTQLAQAQRELIEIKKTREALLDLLRVQSAHVQAGSLTQHDPLAHRQGLVFLANTQHRISEQTQVLQTLLTKQKLLQTECIAQRLKLDGLAKHRAQAEEEYAIETRRRDAAEGDRNWLARKRSLVKMSILTLKEPACL